MWRERADVELGWFRGAQTSCSQLQHGIKEKLNKWDLSEGKTCLHWIIQSDLGTAVPGCAAPIFSAKKTGMSVPGSAAPFFFCQKNWNECPRQCCCHFSVKKSWEWLSQAVLLPVFLPKNLGMAVPGNTSPIFLPKSGNGCSRQCCSHFGFFTK